MAFSTNKRSWQKCQICVAGNLCQFLNFRSCHVDVCDCPKRKECHCESLMAYESACNREGVAVPQWRAPNKCGGKFYGKVMFSQACVKNSVGGGECIPALLWADTPYADTPLGRPPRQTPQADTRPSTTWYGHKREVCILLECILVSS